MSYSRLIDLGYILSVKILDVGTFYGGPVGHPAPPSVL